MDWLKVLAIAFAALGWIQWAKKFFPDLPTVAWGAMLPGVAFGMAAVMFLTPVWFQAAFLAVALAQIGYETIVQAIKKLVGLA